MSGLATIVATAEANAKHIDYDALRTSSYVIYVDFPNDSDHWLLMHSYTGAYDRVNSKVAQFLRSRETIPVSKPLYGEWSANGPTPNSDWSPAPETMAVLVRRGYLTKKTHDGEVEFFKSYVDRLHARQLRTRPHYVIMPTYDCNLRCHYCFQDHMRTDSRFKNLLRTMPVDVADRIMASFYDIEKAYHAESSQLQREFTFFGGEPLLAASRPIVEHIITKQRLEAKSKFGAITNGTELEAYEDLLGPDKLSWLQITIDGPPGLHDQRRIYKDRSGSFAIISQNIDMALRKNIRLSVRVNLDRSNVDSLPALADTFIAHGWASQPNFQPYLAPVHDYAGSGKAGQRPDFFNTWELGQVLSDFYISHPQTRIFSRVDGSLREYAHTIFNNTGASGFKTAYCGAHIGMYVFDALGDIYACWDRTGDRNLRIGTVNKDATVTINGVGERWRSRSVVSNPTCRRCRFALHCGGGCAVLAEGSSGTIFSNYCDVFGKRFRSALAEAYTCVSAASS